MTTADAATIQSRGYALPPRTIVIADDDDEVRAVIAEHLESRGFVVRHAANGLEAILAIKQLRPAAVILDLLMPRLGGLEALNRIRAFDPTIRVVILTGIVDREVHRQALLLGAAALFTKPIVMDDLVQMLSGPMITSGEGEHADSRSAAATSDHPAGSVLIVDDEPEVRAVLREFLDQQGYVTHAAADGRLAIRLVCEERPQVVLLDIVMPELGGIEALMVIRGLAPETRVIMISGKATLEIAKRALAYGAFDYLHKPFDMGHLSEVVAAAFVQPWQ